jgi:hypothetical protein
MMQKYYSLTSKLFLPLFVTQIAVDAIAKTTRVRNNSIVVFLLFVLMTQSQRALALTNSNQLFKPQFSFIKDSMMSPSAQGRGGGGGHGVFCRGKFNYNELTTLVINNKFLNTIK